MRVSCFMDSDYFFSLSSPFLMDVISRLISSADDIDIIERRTPLPVSHRSPLELSLSIQPRYSRAIQARSNRDIHGIHDPGRLKNFQHYPCCNVSTHRHYHIAPVYVPVRVKALVPPSRPGGRGGVRIVREIVILSRVAILRALGWNPIKISGLNFENVEVKILFCGCHIV